MTDVITQGRDGDRYYYELADGARYWYVAEAVAACTDDVVELHGCLGQVGLAINVPGLSAETGGALLDGIYGDPS